MIPKVIHYCWFGKGKYSNRMKQCILSWRKFFPDYQFIEWNESNVDIDNEIPYVKQAYNEKKYAFVSDYIRIKALYNYGGVYFDTDYEVLKDMSFIIREGRLISGFESFRSILTAFIAAEKGHPLLKQLMDSYNDRNFVIDGEYDLTPINVKFSELIESYGIRLDLNSKQNGAEGVIIFPVDILCGFDVNNWHEKITKQTVAVHHMGNSWASPKMKKHIKKIHFMQRIMGYRLYDMLQKYRRRY